MSLGENSLVAAYQGRGQLKVDHLERGWWHTLLDIGNDYPKYKCRPVAYLDLRLYWYHDSALNVVSHHVLVIGLLSVVSGSYVYKVEHNLVEALVLPLRQALSNVPRSLWSYRRDQVRFTNYQRHPWRAVHKVRHARGGGGPRRCDSLWQREEDQEHVTSYTFLSYVWSMKFQVMFNFLL